MKLASLIAAGLVLATVLVGAASLALREQTPPDAPWKQAITEGRVIRLVDYPQMPLGKPLAGDANQAVQDLLVPPPPRGIAPSEVPVVPPVKPE